MKKLIPKKLKTYLRNLLSKIESMVPGYIAPCQDCGDIDRLSYLKEAHKFLCNSCKIRFVKLYVIMNNKSH